MTRILALETSTPDGTVALLDGGELLEARLLRERAHARDLLPAVEGLLTRRGVRLADLDAIAVGLGPGSFTGLRVAVATALGLARGSGVGIPGIPSFDALAFDALAPGEEGLVAADARSGALYAARYLRRAADVETLLAPVAWSLAEARLHLGRAPRVIWASRPPAALAAPAAEAPRAPTAGALARLAGARFFEGALQPSDAAIEPLYLRPFAVRARAVSAGPEH